MDDLIYSGDVTPANQVSVDDFPDAMAKAEEFLSSAELTREEASACIRGWKEYIEELQSRFL